MDADQDRTTPCLTDGNFERVDNFSHGEISRPKVPTEKNEGISSPINEKRLRDCAKSS